MTKFRLPSPRQALPRASFSARVLGLAGLAAGVPYALLAALTLEPQLLRGPLLPAVLILVAAAASGAELFVLRTLLTAIGQLAADARANAALAGAERKDDPLVDEVAAMRADMKNVASRLESVRHRLANRHPVTGAPTREPLLSTIAKDLAKGPRTSAVLGVIRLAQYERLAAVDKSGAERALRVFSARLTELLGGQRPFAQIDRDCFAIWYCDDAGPKDASEALKALADKLGETIGEGDGKYTPDVRAGAALFPHDGRDGPALLNRAVCALGKTDRASEGRVAFFSDESSADAEARFAMEKALRHAIFNRQLTLCYQPVIDLTAGRVVGAEALLRWRHPEVGPIPPAQFIPVLEQSGLIDEVGRWVLDTACRDARDFEALGLPGFRVGVNLTERQFRDPNLPAMVAETLRRNELKPQRLELELTETSLMEDLVRTREVFDGLTKIGVGVAIDDFGAGASSLGDLKSLSFTKLKIDRTFVTDVASRHDSQAICAALIELGRRLDIGVLAEGVETREEVEALRVLGCSLFQGFFFSRPLPADKFMKKVADPEWLSLVAAPAHRPVTLLEDRLAS